MQNNLCAVSVVIPHYNAVNTLRRALISVLRQSTKPYDIVVVDDCSNTCSIEKLLKVLEKPCYKKIVLVIHDSNQGAAAARNTGILRAQGDFVALLDADDVWHPDMISRQVAALEREQADLVCAKYTRYKYGFWKPDSNVKFKVKKLTLFNFIIRNPIKTPTVLFRRHIGLQFPAHLRRCEDYYAWINLLNNNVRIVLNNDVLAYGFKHEIGESGLTGDIRLMHLAHRACIKELYDDGVLPFFGYIFSFVFELAKFQVRKLRCFLR